MHAQGRFAQIARAIGASGTAALGISSLCGVDVAFAAGAASTQDPKIAVVGSTNVDLFTYTPTLPRPGETVMGTGFMQAFGGKGANQAVIAAHLGARVTMVTMVGTDNFGDSCKKNYADCGMTTKFVLRTPDAPTGVAPITVDESGENNIIVVSGANSKLTPVHVATATEHIASAAVLVLQNEVPLETTLAAMKAARAARVTTIFNVAPCPVDGQLPLELYQNADFICVNETELQVMAGVEAGGPEGYMPAAKKLFERGCGCVLVTLGGDGALLVTPSGQEHVKGVTLAKEQVVDTTGAGDAFTGAFAYFLACGHTPASAVARACEVAALTVQKKGCQPSYPRRDRGGFPASLFTAP